MGPVVVENRPGGDGIVAITSFLGAHDDHVLWRPPPPPSRRTPICTRIALQTERSSPIARVSNTIITISVPVSLKLASFADVVAMARASRERSTGRE
jgi:tripartite-type tricarboxylate transporter receptor subunit TctC